MAVIVILFIFGLVILGGIAAAALGGDSETRSGGVAAIVVGVILFGATWVVSSAYYVQAREVGIVSEFGKSTGTGATGLRWDTPWSEVEKFSTANQPLDFDGDERIKFNLAGTDGTSEGEAWVNLNASWQITGDETAMRLWEDRKEFERVRNEVALPNIKSAIAGVMGRYNAQQANDSAKIPEFNRVLMEEVNKAVNPLGIKVEGIAVHRNDLSDAVKAKLEQKNADKIQNDRAVIQQQTAKTEAETNRIKQQQLNELVIMNNCLELTNNWNVAKNGPLPAGWNCMAGTPFNAR